MTTYTIPDMPRQREGSEPKVIVNARVDAEAIQKLDAIAAEMRPKPTRSQMVDVAVQDYVARHQPKKVKER